MHLKIMDEHLRFVSMHCLAWSKSACVCVWREIDCIHLHGHKQNVDQQKR